MRHFPTNLEKLLSLSKKAAKALHFIQFNSDITTGELAEMMSMSKAKMRECCKELTAIRFVEEYNDINGTYGKRGIQYTAKV